MMQKLTDSELNQLSAQLHSKTFDSELDKLEAAWNFIWHLHKNYSPKAILISAYEALSAIDKQSGLSHSDYDKKVAENVSMSDIEHLSDLICKWSVQDNPVPSLL